MRQLDEFYAPPPTNSILHHYTGVGALISIVETRRLWASHAYYLSDSREILYACDLLEQVILESICEYQGEVRSFITEFGQWIETFRVTPHHIYIFSLSEERSLLSQWRSYTPHGKGASIGFSALRLSEQLKGSGGRIVRCIYKPDEQCELLKGLIHKMVTTFKQRIPQLDVSGRPHSQKYYEYLEEFKGTILQVLAILKHPSFNEEREWRIVSPYFPRYTGPEIRFREGASMILPYIEIDISGGGSEQKLFETVILGPSEHPNLSMAAISNFLANKKVCTTTENCLIPYREW